MQNQTSKFYLGLLIFCLLLTSCNIPIGLTQTGDSDLSVEEQAQTIVAQTVAAISGNQTSPDQETPLAPTADVPATNTPEPTLTPTLTLTPTREIPMASVSVDTNCRTGPSKIFDWVGALLVGEKAEVVGRSSEGDYWIIKNPDAAGTCWIWGYYASVTGPTAGLTVYAPPPTPTPLFAWGGSWSVWYGSIGGPFTANTLTITTNGENFSATMLTVGGSVTLSGTMDERHLSVGGTYETSTLSSGEFEFFSLGGNQFQGNFFGTSTPSIIFAWCGARNGAGQPSPCYSP